MALARRNIAIAFAAALMPTGGHAFAEEKENKASTSAAVTPQTEIPALPDTKTDAKKDETSKPDAKTEQALNYTLIDLDKPSTQEFAGTLDTEKIMGLYHLISPYSV